MRMSRARPLAIAGAILVAAAVLLGVARPGSGPYPLLNPVPADSPAPGYVGEPTAKAAPGAGTLGARPSTGPGAARARPCTVGPKLVPTCGVLWGVAPGAFTAMP